MLQVSGLSKSYGSRNLFRDVSFSLGKGECVGLVGRNGSGKSTLFKLILGLEEANQGVISVPKGYRLGYLDQHISFSQDSLIEECVSVLPEEQKFEHYRAEKILFGLGFGQDDLQRDPRQFSGGYQLRINLAKCLLGEPDLLMLDEPTNYLDILSIRWMRQFLKSFTGEVLLITHDREFMDSVTTHTMGLHRGQILKLKGSTEKYYEQIALDEEIYEKTRLNREAKVKQMQQFVDRFRAKASKSTQAQSVLKRMQKMSLLEEMSAEQMLGFRFNYLETPAKTLLTATDLSFGFAGQPPLFSELSFELKAEDCIAVIGKNGKGKTTLLNVIAGHYQPLSGQIRLHPSTEIGYYQQTHRKDLDSKATIVEEIEKANLDLDLTAVRAICGAMMFSGDDASKKIGVLSGGEQARVLLGKILAHKNNLLLLDEPTNHLDMESIEALTNEVSVFPGATMIVTHNEDMIRRLASALIVFNGNQSFFFRGSYDEFLDKVGWDNPGKSEALGSSPRASNKGSRESRHERAQLVVERSRKLSPLKKRQQELETKLSEGESELNKLNEQVMDLLTSQASGNEIQETYKRIGQLQLSLEGHYTELEDVLKKIEALS